MDAPNPSRPSAAAPPSARPSAATVAYAALSGLACHLSFAAAVLAMILVMLSGMTLGLGRLPSPWSLIANGALLAQFIASHSLLLGRRGGGVLRRLAPGRLGGPMATTTYVTVVSLQVLALFVLWTPSGVVWWRATGGLRLALMLADGAAWLMLLKAIIDAGFALQSGLLGWRAVATGTPPRYPPMPTTGLFKGIRQPIYLAFALTTWATPVWTPDQLVVASILTGYCALGPLLKERRFTARYGAAFTAYRAATPYWMPRLRARRP